MSKFKVGDEVIFKSPHSTHYGKTGKFLNVSNISGMCEVELSTSRHVVPTFEDYLELVQPNTAAVQQTTVSTFKPGDRVVYNDPGTTHGLKGIVVSVYPGNVYTYEVLFDGAISFSRVDPKYLVLDQSGQSQALTPNYQRVTSGTWTVQGTPTLQSNNGTPWILTQGWGSLEEATKNAGAGDYGMPAAKKVCQCGTTKVMGEGVPADMHSDYCPIFKEADETAKMLKAIEKK